MNTIPGTVIAERGSLQLHHFSGSETEPETFTVSLIADPNLSASLEIARHWHELATERGDTVRLNGSQAVTVKLWFERFL